MTQVKFYKVAALPGSPVANSIYFVANGADFELYVTSSGGVARAIIAPTPSASTLLTAIKTVDGAGSELDADLLDGLSSAAFALSGHTHSGVYQPADADLDTWAGLTPSAYFQTLVDDANASTAQTTLGLGTLATQSGTFSGTSSGTNTGDQTISLTGDVTGSGTGSFAATVANDAITYAKLQNASAGFVLLGKADTGAGDFAEIALGANEVLRRSGSGNVVGGALVAGNFADNTLVAARLSATAQYVLFGRSSAAAGAGEEVATSANVYTMLGSVDNSAIRSNIGLGTIATQAANSVAITGGSVTGITDLTVADGGTGSSTAADARTALGAAASGANTDVTSIYLNNTGLKLKDTNASHGLTIAAGTDLTADRVFTLTTGDAARTLDISAANVTISTAGAALIDDANAAAMRVSLGLSGATSVVRQVFTATGTYTPTTGMVYCDIECLGGGGAGGGVQGALNYTLQGSGGGAGGYSNAVKTAAQVGASQAVAIGAAGAGNSGASGGAGGDTSVGALCIGKGAAGGAACTTGFAPTGAAGGIAGTGDFKATGAPGGPGFYYASSAILLISGITYGGSSVYGGGGVGPIASTSTVAGNAAGNYGSGGSGAASHNTASNAAGGAGSPGVVIITEFVMT